MLTDEQVKEFIELMRKHATEANEQVEKFLTMKPTPSSLLNDAIGTRNTFDFVADLLEEINR